jgi:hypothetical protein
MTRNGKIALGCGGGGCLGLIVLVVLVGVLIFTGVIKAPGIYSPPDSSSNYNYNRNSNIDTNVNTNDNSNSNSTTDNSNSSSDSSSTMSEDDKHKLYQAAGTCGDTQLLMRALRKVGLGDGTGADHQDFIKAHYAWALKNIAFINSINTKEKALAYVEAHIDD